MPFTALSTAPATAATAVSGVWAAVQPHGLSFHGSLDRLVPEHLGPPLRSCAVSAHLSKSHRLPWGLPAVSALSIRLPPSQPQDRPWDVLMASAAGMVSRRIPWPTTAWENVRFSSLQPVRVGTEQWWLRARISSPPLNTVNIDDIAAAVARSRLSIVIDQALGSGPFEPVAVLHSTALACAADPAASVFDPMRNRPPTIGPHSSNWFPRILTRTVAPSARM